MYPFIYRYFSIFCPDAFKVVCWKGLKIDLDVKTWHCICFRQQGDFVDVDFILGFDKIIDENQAQEDVSEIVFDSLPRVTVSNTVGNNVVNNVGNTIGNSTVVYYNSSLSYTDYVYGKYTFYSIINPFPHTTILQQTTLNLFCQMDD